MATFSVNGEERKLRMTTPAGVDWSDDYIGGFDHGMTRDEDGRYICSDADFQWWAKAIADQVDADRLIAEYREKYGDAVDEVLPYVNTDPEEYLASVKMNLACLDD